MKNKKTWEVAFAASDEDYLTDEELAELRFKQGIAKRLTNKIRERRRDRDITQKELASKTGISESKIKKIESNGNETLPSVPELVRISDYFGFSMDYFCRDKIKKTDKENAIRYTGLSEKSVLFIKKLQPYEKQAINQLIENAPDLIQHLIHNLYYYPGTLAESDSWIEQYNNYDNEMIKMSRKALSVLTDDEDEQQELLEKFSDRQSIDEWKELGIKYKDKINEYSKCYRAIVSSEEYKKAKDSADKAHNNAVYWKNQGSVCRLNSNQFMSEIYDFLDELHKKAARTRKG